MRYPEAFWIAESGSVRLGIRGRFRRQRGKSSHLPENPNVTRKPDLQLERATDTLMGLIPLHRRAKSQANTTRPPCCGRTRSREAIPSFEPNEGRAGDSGR